MKNNTMEERFDEDFKSSYEYPFVFDKQCNQHVKKFIRNEILLAEESLVRRVVEAVKGLERERPMNDFFDTMRRVRGDNIDSEDEVKRRDARFREERIIFGSHCDALVEVLNLPILSTPKPKGDK